MSDNRDHKEQHIYEMDIINDYRMMIKRLFILVLVVLGLWACTIGGFVWYLNQYDFVSYTQDGEGYNNINNRVEGDIYNNGAESQSQNPEGQGEGSSRS